MNTKSEEKRVGFIGAGRMATALAKGFLSANLIPVENMIASDVFEDARTHFERETGAPAVVSNLEVAKRSNVIVLAVKPQHLKSVLTELVDSVTGEHLVVSIAAGMTLETIETILGNECRFVRVMPNTPCLLGVGASAFALGKNVTSADAEFVRQMLSTVGIAEEVPEPLMDAVTGLSGSGPAFVYQVIEALSDGGVRMGLPRPVATQLAAQTVMGAAKMVLETGEHPGVLKDAVTSPGGTTIAGLHALEEGGLRGALITAVQAAAERSQELGQS
ncbi:MAG: pyrroline-5-carboxylate reductase [Planctomycetaceae bacterium]